MSMHLLGPHVTTTATSRRKKKSKSKRLEKANQEHDAWLAKMGVGKVKNKKKQSLNAIPSYKSERVTSDEIPANGAAKERKQYTGNEIAGFVVTHKSNSMPIRKDNMQAAKDAANMRR